ncbi:MAG TPA: hypothetical protein VEV87_03760 [Chitinophagaceae bacterium]|nr:hypothetical protein [Chitinophagaceae bacterium]
MFALSTRFHAILDYFFGFLLMIAPSLFGFGKGEWETIIPILSGMIICFYSFFSNYKGGFYPVIPMKIHYAFDLAIGILVTTSPWIFGFRDLVYKPHALIGFAVFLIGIFGVRPFEKLQKLRLHRPLSNLMRFD